jgi:hypothetical protein
MAAGRCGCRSLVSTVVVGWIGLFAQTAAEASSLRQEQPPSKTELRVPSDRFDPIADGEPEIPDGMRAPAGAPGFRLAQPSGEVTDDLLEALVSVGVKPLHYYPHHGFCAGIPQGTRLPG